MRALPLILAVASAAVLTPAFLQSLVQAGFTRPNYRGRELPVPLGAMVPAAAMVALIPLTLIDRLGPTEVFQPELLPIAIYVLGVAFLGLIDDALKREGGPRGWRGHGAAALRGEVSTGALKAAGSLGLALLAMSYLSLSDGHWLLATAVLVLATNLFNLLDLRPGRSAKAFVLLGAGLSIGAWEVRPLWALGLFAGPAVLAGVYDLRERAMLGDTGANLLGALAGLWLVLTLSATGQLIALILLAGITLYGEISSISALVERTPGLRELDSWGRPS
jgi:UDP-GlcNAc:undecaprenyl-phosphate/decaprenyl-phosphate GlcNAc-1-phosphate transferase